MPVSFKRYVQCQTDVNELAQVTQIADRLLNYLNQPEVQQAIALLINPDKAAAWYRMLRLIAG